MSIVDVANVAARIEDHSWNPSAMKWDVFNPNSLAQANNNPGNLWFVGQKGAVAGKGGFAKFDTIEDGFTAYENQIALDAGRGLDYGSFLEKMTPKAQNPNFDRNTAAGWLGVSLTDKLKDIIGNVGHVGSSPDVTPTASLADLFGGGDPSSSEDGSMSMEVILAMVGIGIVGGFLILK